MVSRPSATTAAVRHTQWGLLMIASVHCSSAGSRDSVVAGAVVVDDGLDVARTPSSSPLMSASATPPPASSATTAPATPSAISRLRRSVLPVGGGPTGAAAAAGRCPVRSAARLTTVSPPGRRGTAGRTVDAAAATGATTVGPAAGPAGEPAAGPAGELVGDPVAGLAGAPAGRPTGRPAGGPAGGGGVCGR